MDILSEGLFVGFLTFPFLRQENNIIFKNIGENKWRVCGNDNLQITGNRFLYNFAQIRDIQSLPFRMVIQISLIYKQNGGIIFNDGFILIRPSTVSKTFYQLLIVGITFHTPV